MLLTEMRNKILVLIGLFAVIAGLFFFSSWSNAMVVSEVPVSSGVKALSWFSPFLIGVLALMIIGVLIRLSVEH